jgi:peptidoglycan/LPS O-acetylase OafA/YrhL
MNPDHYRSDIDGLRAIAVVSVIVFHLKSSLLPGGFVGVDIFFAISGYLITKNIAEGMEAGRFSIIEFYRRRIKRIAPVMLTVIASVLCIGYLVLLPEELVALAKSAIWSVGSLANVYFWHEVDTEYFATASSQLPLLHLWSLGVEEQFYLIWPLLLIDLAPEKWSS